MKLNPCLTQAILQGWEQEGSLYGSMYYEISCSKIAFILHKKKIVSEFVRGGFLNHDRSKIQNEFNNRSSKNTQTTAGEIFYLLSFSVCSSAFIFHVLWLCIQVLRKYRNRRMLNNSHVFIHCAGFACSLYLVYKHSRAALTCSVEKVNTSSV